MVDTEGALAVVISGGDNATSRVHLEPLAVRAHDQPVTGLAFRPGTNLDSSTGPMLVLATTSVDSTVRIWSCTSQGKLHLTATLAAKTSRAPGMCIAFSPSGSTIAQATGDGTVRVWKFPEQLRFSDTAAGSGGSDSARFTRVAKHEGFPSSVKAITYLWRGAVLVAATSGGSQ